MKNIITDSIRTAREYEGICALCGDVGFRQNKLPILVTGLSEGARIALYASLSEDCRKRREAGANLPPPLCIVPDEKEALRLSNAFADLGLRTHTYPFSDLVFHNIIASHETEQERLAVLLSVLAGDCDIVFTTPDAALQFTIPKSRLQEETFLLEAGEDYYFDDILAFLDGAGYTRTEQVDGIGQYAVRGGMLDVFPPQQTFPLRIDFFGDTLDTMEYFDPLTQRRTEYVDTARLTPARELLLSPEAKEAILAEIASRRKKASGSAATVLDSEREALKAGTELYSLAKYISLVYPEKSTLFDYFPGALILVQESNAIADRLKSFEWHAQQNVTELLQDGLISSRIAEYNLWAADFDSITARAGAVFCNTFASDMSGQRLAGMFTFVCKNTVSYADSLPLLCEDLEHYIKAAYFTVLMCDSESAARHTVDLLEEAGIHAVLSNTAEPERGVPVVSWEFHLPGFELPPQRFAALSLCAHQNAYSRNSAVRQKSVRRKKAQNKIMSYTDLHVGDYVVHATHGIGQYLGLQSLTVDGVTKDFVKIQYAGSDMLYLPCNQLDAVSKYIGAGADSGDLKLSKMGGAEWGRAKARVKAAAKEMARELIALYAERARREGFAHDADTDMMRDFEASFEYEETDGQLAAMVDIKRDMEKSVPMDRLLCGDVGYGKTEVALRAAFKAVCSGKQVAILVPTTILALQHYQTMLSRMRGFPVQCDMLSRFRTPKQQQETLRKLRRGEIDIIVGTHRLVSDDVTFRDLGLVIIDEEQRFGVAHKEKLKKLARNVDVLTLTATPIPRTLNMAMSGIRDMSLLEEAPGDRQPVQSYVLEYDALIVGEAIRKELRRGGQVFYLHNRVESIYETAAKIREMAPDAAVTVAHGQMDKEELSDIWRAMVNGEIDVLVCTTIIETGVDVPNANTLIIENADDMGLSQLHQLRGRVGRSSRRAYAYFTYPTGSALTEVAEKRLGAIRDFTEFGAGFRIALRDLEIRGAGNLLGAEQHGHIDTIGYELYMKLLNEAILEEKGEELPSRSECSVDLSLDAFIPETYIKAPVQRIDAYRRIAAIETDADLDDVADELTDRYGEMPRSVHNLLYISLLRSLACLAGFDKVEQKGETVLIRDSKPNLAVWTKMAAENRGRLLLNLSAKPYVSYRLRRGEDLLECLIALFKKYLEYQDEKS